MIFHRASLKRSPRTRTRKHTSADMDIAGPPARDSSLTRQKTRPPPLQIIPEMSENDNATHSPTTARPTQSMRRPQLMDSRITLSAYTFSIDDALLMFGGGGEPRSPALSASSSTSDGASSEGVPATPRASDDENASDFMLSTRYLHTQRISIRPLCITKTRSLICQEDEDVHSFCEKEDQAIHHSATKDIYERSTEAKVAMEAAEADHDFYNREFESFISLCPATPSPTLPARRDSLVIVTETLPPVVDVAKTKPRGRSRHSKPLPLLPPVTPPLSTFPPIQTLPLVHTAARRSVVRRKRNVSSLPNSLPPPPPAVARPLPRMEVPLDIDDCVFHEESFDVPFRESISERDCDTKEEASVNSEPSSMYTVSSASPLPLAFPETPISGMYSKAILPRSSTDSGAPRSSTDSTPSLTSSTLSDGPISPLPFPSSPSEDRLCSRWSTSTLGSLAVEPPRPNMLISPFINVFGSRSRRVPPPLPKMPPQVLKGKHGCTPSASGKHIRGQDSRSSTSSTGSTSSDSDSRGGSPSGLKRKPTPVAMFLRAT